jgi:hypothetical protein
VVALVAATMIKSAATPAIIQPVAFFSDFIKSPFYEKRGRILILREWFQIDKRNQFML